jgi:hypothetical protein
MDRVGPSGYGPGLRRAWAASEAGTGTGDGIEEGRAQLPVGADYFVFFFLLFGLLRGLTLRALRTAHW